LLKYDELLKYHLVAAFCASAVWIWSHLPIKHINPLKTHFYMTIHIMRNL